MILESITETKVIKNIQGSNHYLDFVADPSDPQLHCPSIKGIVYKTTSIIFNSLDGPCELALGNENGISVV